LGSALADSARDVLSGSGYFAKVERVQGKYARDRIPPAADVVLGGDIKRFFMTDGPSPVAFINPMTLFCLIGLPTGYGHLEGDFEARLVMLNARTEGQLSELGLSGHFGPDSNWSGPFWEAHDRQVGGEKLMRVYATDFQNKLSAELRTSLGAALVALDPSSAKARIASAQAQPPAATTQVDPVDQAPITKMRQDNAHAIVVGVERYRGAEIPAAAFAENDARVFAAFLTRTLGVPEKNIRLLVGEEATKTDIEAALLEWLPRVVSQGGTTYFFFSGHGAPDPTTGTSYLIPYDGDPAYLRTKALQLSVVYSELAKLPEQRVIAFLDSCFSGSGPRSVLPAGLRPLVPVKATIPQGGTMAVYGAAQGSEVTGPARGGARHGLFTYHLLRGLSGLADRDGDRTITLNELQMFVDRTVSEDARQENRSQNPQLSLTSGRPGDWVIVDGLVK